MFVFPYCCSFCLHSGCFPSSLMMKFKLSPKRRKISGSGKYKDREMEQTETLFSALLRSQPWPQDAQTSCKCNLCTVGLRPHALVLYYFYISEWGNRCGSEKSAHPRTLCCNHSSAIKSPSEQLCFSCSMWLLHQPSSNMNLNLYMDNSEKSENS